MVDGDTRTRRDGCGSRGCQKEGMCQEQASSAALRMLFCDTMEANRNIIASEKPPDYFKDAAQKIII